jgi:hypothetical protein
MYVTSKTVGLIVATTFSYFIEKERKGSFYYSDHDNLKTKWLSSILDKMNTGYISIKDDKIFFINSCSTQKFNSWKYLQNEYLADERLKQVNFKYDSTTKKFYIHKDSSILIIDLIKNLIPNFDQDVLISEFNNLKQNEENNSPKIQKFYEILTKISNNNYNEFNYLGEKISKRGE